MSQTDSLSLLSCYNSCVLHLTLGSPLHHLSFVTTMGTADSFKPFSLPLGKDSPRTGLKVSPGNALLLSHLCLPHLHRYLPCKYWASVTYDTLPRNDASYEVPVRQTSVLPSASFRHSLTGLPLLSANASPYRVHRGLAPPSISALPGTHKKTAPKMRRLIIFNDPSFTLSVFQVSLQI